ESRSDTVNTRPGSSSISRMRELILQLRRRGGDADDEFGSLHRFASHADRTTMGFHDLLDQIEPEARAVHLVLHRAAAPEKWIEDIILLVERDAGTMIGDPDFDGRAFGIGGGSREDPDPVASFGPIL